MDHLFLSDVHIGATTDESGRRSEQDLISLIEFATRNRFRICVLGDLFDYWMEYPDTRPEIGEDVLHAFREHNRSVSSTLYITGNHDNWTSGYFEKIGFRVEPESSVIELDDLSFFLHHGDGLADPEINLPRPLFHRVLRNERFVSLYQSIFPPEAGIDLMRRFSAMSRENSETDPQRLSEWSEAFLKHTDTDVVISGHDHIPRVETFPFGSYINLGTFYEHRTVALYTNGQLRLVTWSADDQQFQPTNSSVRYADRHSS